ncbi:LCP family protein [Streptomyces sp. NPDC001292]|uniref:LCP family glycopolymer transferase n=1 Tax=Streptomyces sp. NPDC001292 TaxID=3364558 RepID=UPI003686C12F
MVLHIAANRKWAAVVSLPRDSWVQIPACDRGNGTTSAPHHFKINEAFAIGGTTGDIGGAAACTIASLLQQPEEPGRLRGAHRRQPHRRRRG